MPQPRKGSHPAQALFLEENIQTILSLDSADKPGRGINSVANLESRTTSLGGFPKRARLCPNSACKIGGRLEAAKPVAWKGLGELPQVSWATEQSGLYLVVDLWSGISGTIMALLALGIRVIALAAEWDEDARDVAAKNMPNRAGYVQEGLIKANILGDHHWGRQPVPRQLEPQRLQKRPRRRTIPPAATFK